MSSLLAAISILLSALGLLQPAQADPKSDPPSQKPQQPVKEPNADPPEPPSDKPETTLFTPVEVVPVSNDPAIKTAENLLDALETADRDLRTLQAELAWEKTFEIQGDEQTRLGRLVFKSTPAKAGTTPNAGPEGKPDAGAAGKAEAKPESAAGNAESRERSFEIRFDKLVVGRRVEDRSEVYIFDGQWLIEKQPDQKLMIKRQVAPPGEKFDPLRVGEGQLPIPIGQRKKDILDRFDAELVPVDDLIAGEDRPDLVEFVKDTIQVRLTPRPELKDSSEFEEIRLWYKKASELPGAPYLPRMARAVNRQSDVSLVRLINMQINETLPAGVLDTSEPQGWQVQVRPYRHGE